MRKHQKTLLAYLLTAAMLLGTMGVTGFAGELQGDSGAQVKADAAAVLTETEDGLEEALTAGEAVPEGTQQEVSEPEEEVLTVQSETEASGEEENKAPEGEVDVLPAAGEAGAESPAEAPAAPEAGEEEKAAGEEAAFPEAAAGESGEQVLPAAGAEAAEAVTDEEAAEPVPDPADMTVMDTTAIKKYVYEYDGKYHEPDDIKVTQADISSITVQVDNVPENPVNNTSAVRGRMNAGITYVRVVLTNGSLLEYVVIVNPRPVTYESKTVSKVYDGTPLSGNAADVQLTSGTLAEGEEFSITATASIKEVGSTPNTFELKSANPLTLSANYAITKKLGNLIIAEGQKDANNLASPKGAKAVFNKKGGVKVSWKAVKTYKPSSGGKKKKAVYDVYRYNRQGTWDRLVEGTKKLNFTDNANLSTDVEDNAIFVYKIVARGVDNNGTEGQGEPAYVQTNTKIMSVSPKGGHLNIQFATGNRESGSFVIRHYETKKAKVYEDIQLYDKDLTPAEYKAKNAVRTISTNIYADKGGTDIVIQDQMNHTYGFKVMSDEYRVYDYGNEITVPSTKWSTAVKCKLVATAPKVTGKGERERITWSWKKIKGATGYLVEYSTEPTFTDPDKLETYFCDKDHNENMFENLRYVRRRDVVFGMPVYCRVTAYQKKKGDTTDRGTELDTSEVVMEYGRQDPVTNLKAENFEDGLDRSDARLTWKNNESNIVGYYVKRWSYEYNPQTKKFDILKTEKILQDYKVGNTNKSWSNSAENAIDNADLVKYSVQSVYYTAQTATLRLGENGDGYVFSEPEYYYFMNPAEFKFTSTSYTVPVDSEKKTVLKFKDKKPSTFDGLSKTTFAGKFLYNDAVEYSLYSPDLNNSQIKKYLTVSEKGVITATRNLPSGEEVYLVATCKGDNKVFQEVRVKTSKTSGSSSGSNGDSGNSDSSSDTLVICIDPGHGGSDAGASYGGRKEKDLNLEIALKLRDKLKEKGGKKVNVYMTRTTDTFVELTTRTDIAKEHNCNLFVSVHCDSSSDSSVQGTTVYYSVNSRYAKKTLATQIAKAVGSVVSKSRGAKQREGDNGDYYSVIRTSAAKGIPGMIVEHGFMTNSEDLKMLVNAQDTIADREAEAILNNWKK